jgi:hypothetical protein
MTRFSLFRDAFGSQFWLREMGFRPFFIATDVEALTLQIRQQVHANEFGADLAQSLTAAENDATVNSHPREISGMALGMGG